MQSLRSKQHTIWKFDAVTEFCIIPSKVTGKWSNQMKQKLFILSVLYI